MARKPMDLPPNIRRSPMERFFGKKNQAARNENIGTPKTRSFTREQQDLVHCGLAPR